jgi:hypothetical protein
LSNIKDPAAAQAGHTVLHASAGEQRRAIEDGLVAQRHAHAVSCVSGGTWAVVGAVDPEAAGIDPLLYM